MPDNSPVRPFLPVLGFPVALVGLIIGIRIVLVIATRGASERGRR
jgi:hypothetical protein